MGYVSAEIVNGKETGRLIADNMFENGVQKTFIEDIGFIKFTPVTITVKMRTIMDIVFGRPGKDVEIRTGEVKQEKLGKSISPADFFPQNKP